MNGAQKIAREFQDYMHNATGKPEQEVYEAIASYLVLFADAIAAHELMPEEYKESCITEVPVTKITKTPEACENYTDDCFRDPCPDCSCGV